MDNKLTKQKAVEGCWKTGKNPTTCQECGLYSICYKMYHSEDSAVKRRQNLKLRR